MNITPVSLNFGRYYNFETNDPRKSHPNFRLGMPDKEVVETVSGGDLRDGMPPGSLFSGAGEEST